MKQKDESLRLVEEGMWGYFLRASPGFLRDPAVSENLGRTDLCCVGLVLRQKVLSENAAGEKGSAGEG